MYQTQLYKMEEDTAAATTAGDDADVIAALAARHVG